MLENLSQLPKLNRFTTIPYLIDILITKKLTLLNPKTWQDHNDVDLLLDYKSKEKIPGLVALCFTHGNETIHHWTAFSNNESGCCIEFNKEILLTVLDKDERIKHAKVKYISLNKLPKAEIPTKDIPFNKRYPYSCEAEYRVIAILKEDAMTYPIDIPLNSIAKITLSPKLPESTFENLKSLLTGLIGDEHIEINQSSLFKNKEWIENFKNRTTLNGT